MAQQRDRHAQPGDWRQTAATLASVLSVLLVAAGLLYTNAANRDQLMLTERGQVTDRFTRAIDQIGSDKLDVRIGGIYALERLMRDSPDDGTRLIKVLLTFVREHALPSSGLTPDEPADRTSQSRTLASRSKVASDVQAALDVLGHHFNGSSGIRGLDLSGLDLTGVILVDAYLVEANLGGTDLSGAALIGADMRNAYLQYADLSEAILGGADLGGADLEFADLNDTWLVGANFAGVDLRPTYGLTDDHLRCIRVDDETVLTPRMERPMPDSHLSRACEESLVR
ncbi:pentapeptide repeat-containing protein [Actinoplanes sp. Pm04-4]|uniref:Pentapeptide repeat-containing protein n=1 Tax=Paractinoplanes pyxinae TaxID=2997416 RepID=A0ABT4B6E9_9ACTN|nr:pentapeptide repeat-containing protein [Actinoplanes pyxinae]MCY1141415.1 pentapeptide repeat-containing protein [Actinoplanes pyxinae]